VGFWFWDARRRSRTTIIHVLPLFAFCISASPIWAEDKDATAILFSGRDIWHNGAFAYGGILLAPGGFEQDGLLLKLLYSAGVYRYNSSFFQGSEVIGFELAGSVMPGWRIKRNRLETKFFLGPEFEQHRLWPDDPSNVLRGSAIGLRAAVEFWYEPSPTTILTGEVSLTTIATNNSARLAYGWHVFDDILTGFYIGPEIQYFSSDGYRHLRVGSHITGVKTEQHEWSAGFGWVGDSSKRSGPYLRLGYLTRH
jgi:hypothetical protein